jgi:CubicO group peptidase (beta-lactamase class C family)
MVPPIDRLITSAIEQRIFPGAVVLAARDGMLHYAAAYGTTMYDDPGSQPVTLTTRYDIASLTKMFTATAALRLYDAGVLALDTPVVHYLPDVAARTVTVRHLLTHTSGLELRLSSLRHHNAAGLRAAVYATLPTCAPGTRTAYVNISSLLLGDVVAQAAGLPLDSAIQQLVLEPLDLRDTFFCPPDHLRAEVAPTEWDETWRGCLVQGRVHDESTHALGEVAGHAGLFSTATDLWHFMQMWLDGGAWAGTRLLRPETVALATSYQSAWLRLDEQQPAIRCGLGWMLDRADIMGTAPAGSYGHTGFTGPVLVAIPAQRVAVVFLCNRTYPRRTTERSHLPVVAAVVDAVLQGAC